MAEPFPRAALNPSAKPWAREVEKRLLDVDSQVEQAVQRLLSQGRTLGSLRGRRPEANGDIYRDNGIVVPPQGSQLIYSYGLDADGNNVSLVTGREAALPYTIYYGTDEDDSEGDYSAIAMQPEYLFLRNNRRNRPDGTSAVLTLAGGTSGIDGGDVSSGGGDSSGVFDGYFATPSTFAVEFGDSANQTNGNGNSFFDPTANRWAIRYLGGRGAGNLAGGYNSMLSLMDGFLVMGAVDGGADSFGAPAQGFIIDGWLSGIASLDDGGGIIRTLKVAPGVTVEGFGDGGGSSGGGGTGGGSNFADVFQGAYENKTYARGDVVTSGGQTWVAVRAVGTATSEAPGFGNAWVAFASDQDRTYSLVAQAVQRAPWNSTLTYPQDSLVTWQHSLWVAVSNVPAGKLPPTEDYSEGFWWRKVALFDAAGSGVYSLEQAYAGDWADLPPAGVVDVMDKGWLYDRAGINNFPSSLGRRSSVVQTNSTFRDGNSPSDPTLYTPWSEILCAWMEPPSNPGQAGSGGFAFGVQGLGGRTLKFNVKINVVDAYDSAARLPQFGFYDGTTNPTPPKPYEPAYTDDQGKFHPEVPATQYIWTAQSTLDWQQVSLTIPSGATTLVFWAHDQHGVAWLTKIGAYHTSQTATLEAGQVVDYEGGVYLALQDVTAPAPVDDGTTFTLLGRKTAEQAVLPYASHENEGIVRLARADEVAAGADDSTAVTPQQLSTWGQTHVGTQPAATETTPGIVQLATVNETVVGQADTSVTTPATVKAAIEAYADANPGFSLTPHWKGEWVSPGTTPPASTVYDFADGQVPAAFTTSGAVSVAQASAFTDLGVAPTAKILRLQGVGDNQETSVYWTFTLVADGVFSYDRALSTEQGADFAFLFIDGNQTWAEAGNVTDGGTDYAFQHREHPLAAGQHTVGFRYIKDQSVSSHDDSLFLANVSADPTQVVTAITGYAADDLVRHDGALYLALTDTGSEMPPAGGDATWAELVPKVEAAVGGGGGGTGPLVTGPANTLTMPGIWIETDASGNYLQWWFDDHGGGGGSNTEGDVSFGPTNGLQGAGLWIQTDADGVPQMFFYDDGTH